MKPLFAVIGSRTDRLTANIDRKIEGGKRVLCHLKGVVALVKVLVDLVQCINGSIARLDEAAMSKSKQQQ